MSGLGGGQGCNRGTKGEGMQEMGGKVGKQVKEVIW